MTSHSYGPFHFTRATFQLIVAVSLIASFPSCRGLRTTTAQGEENKHITVCLQQARLAWQVMQQETPNSAPAEEALQKYNLSVETLVKYFNKKKQTDSWGQEMFLAGAPPWRLTFDTPARNDSARTLSPSDFSQCLPATEVKLQGFDRVVAHRGLGIPVVLTQNDPHRVSNPFHATKGEFLPATAVLEFPSTGAGQPIEARFRFYNPLETSEVNVGPHSKPLAENLTAPLQLALTDDIPDRKRVPAAPGTMESHLFFINRYHKNRVPVVFVHGLRCGPSVWKNSINALFEDPELRRRYQPVCFIYPTQLSIPASASHLRELLKLSRHRFDPGHDDAGFNHIVLVGHSMGGLLARMQVIDSGNDFWQAFFTAPPQEIEQQVDAETAKMVKQSLFFQHQQNVGNVVFISTPHRGSELADIGILRVLARVILVLPETAGKRLKELTALPPAYIHPTLRSFHDWGIEGTENLSTKHPYFRALARHPIRAPYHSIIASRDPFDYRNSDDGRVPYWSSHLDGAASETIVPYPHACLEKPATVRALMKVLKESR